MHLRLDYEDYKKIEGIFSDLGLSDVPCEKLPKMFSSIFEDSNLVIECGNGWAPLLHQMLLILKQSKTKLKITFIKESFAVLRVSFHGRDDFSERVIELAVLASTHICESCGKPGKDRDIDGWHKALCDNPQCYAY